MDYEGLERARQEDAEFFQRWPDREYRLRRAWNCEFGPGNVPRGFAVFAIVYRREKIPQELFPAPLTLETDQSDADIREMLVALQANSRAMLNGLKA